MYKKLRIFGRNLQLSLKFIRYRRKLTSQLKDSSDIALIVGTGTSYLKFKDVMPDIILKKNVDIAIGLNNLLFYDPTASNFLTDYVISYSGYFEDELNDAVVQHYSDDGDFSAGGALESLTVCRATLELLTKCDNLRVWVPIEHYAKFENLAHFFPYSNSADLNSNNMSNIKKSVYGNGMVALYAAAIAKHQGCKQIFSVGLDNDSFKGLEWNNSEKKYTYKYAHFYNELETSVNRYYSGCLSEYFSTVSKIHKLFWDYEIINLDETSVSGFKQ